MRNAKLLLGLTVLGTALTVGYAQGQDPRADKSTEEIRSYEQEFDTNSSGAWWKLAIFYQNSARFGDAERAYGKALELMRSGNPVALANVMDCMGTMYVQTGRFAEAEQLERKALAIRQDQKDSSGVGLSWMHLAMLSMGKHDIADAETYAELAVERLVSDRRENVATEEQKMTALAYLALARCAARECSEAMAPLKKAMTIAEAGYARKSFPISYLQFLEGYVDWKRGDRRAAAKLMKIGTEGMEVQLGWGHPTLGLAMRQYEEFLVATKRTAEAMEVQEKLVRLAGTQAIAGTVPGAEWSR
jgi:tetratricopeptide (TPR) repeat protein